MYRHLHLILLAGLSGAALLAGPPARAADASKPTGPTVSEIVVTADPVGLLEKRPSTTVFGLSKPLIETPRSATLITDTNIQRYGIQTIDQLTTVAPGTFTASFYGVPGTLNIRGTLAENYFEGFKLITNFGTYATPVGAASRIDIVRGPPSPIYGPGFVGGLLNFIPKTAGEGGEAPTSTTGELSYTGGSYNKNNVKAQVGLPVHVGDISGGVYVYGEYDNSDSYYRGIHPEHEMGQMSARFDLPEDWKFSADVSYYHSSGDVQTPGWNRLTQNLINSGTYITGRNTALSNTPGVPYLTPAQASPTAPYYPFDFNKCGDAGMACGYFGFYGGPPLANFPLATGVGMATLSPHNVYVSSQDFSTTSTPTVYLGLTKHLAWADSTLKFEAFYNGLENKRYVSYGFPAWERAQAYEGRATYDFKLGTPDESVTADTIVGASIRYDYSRNMESFDSGLIALDRRDLTVGATPTDSLCNPFTVGDTNDQVPANCMGWETDIHTTWFDYGQFLTTDVSFFKRLDVVLGGRLDEYRVTSADTGILSFDYGAHPNGTRLTVTKTEPTYTASITYKLPFGLMPYGTYAHTAALEVDQAADITTSLLENGGWIQYSTLEEGGVKFQELGGRLVGSLDYYHQDRPKLSGLPPRVIRTVSSGEELEVRWVATKNFSFTFAGNMQHTIVRGPDTTFAYLPAATVCGNATTCLVNSYGGQFITFNFSTVPGRSGNYQYLPIPHSVLSLYGNYVSDAHNWGRVGATAGFQHTSFTSGTVPGAVVYPAYYLANMSLFYQYKKFEIDLNIDNLLDQRYFTPDADTYVNMGALPGVGREVFATVKARF